MNLLNRINNWGKRHMVWLVIIMFVGFMMWLFAPPSNINYIIRANGTTYHCSRYEIDNVPDTHLSVDDKGAITFVLSPTYNIRLYDWEPRHWIRVKTGEFTCKTYQVNMVTDVEKRK